MTDEGPGVEYPGNSKKSKKAEKPESVEKVVSGEIVVRKKPLGRRLAESFNGDDSRSVGQYVLFDIIIPEVKRIISDVVSQGVERLLFGDNARSRSSGGDGRRRTAYDRYHDNKKRDDQPHLSRAARTTHDFRDIVVRERGEAERVKDGLIEYLDLYDQVPLTVFYDLIGVSGSFQDEEWGWYDLRGIRVLPARGGGYMFDLPRPEHLDRR